MAERRVKTRSDILAQIYLTKKDIQQLMQVSYPVAVRTFNQAMEIDKAEMKFRPWETRVRTQTVIDVCGVTYAQLEKHIKSATS